MSAEDIAQVVADLRAERVRSATDEEFIDKWARAAAVLGVMTGPVIDATALYQSQAESPKDIAIYEDHNIAPPWESALVAYRNQHGNIIVTALFATEDVQSLIAKKGGKAPWEDANPECRWADVRWIVDAFVFIGGRDGNGNHMPTSGPVHMWRHAVYPDGGIADIRWLHLMPDHPMEHWDMAQVVVLGCLTFLTCFAAETPIVTRDGIVPIGKVAGQEVEVLSRRPDAHTTASFCKARIESFGRQPLIELQVQRNGERRTIRTTSGHRWFVRHRSQKRGERSSRIVERTTAELVPGDRLVTVRPRSTAEICRISGIGVAHGLVYGDGTRRASPRDGCAIQLFGEDRYELLRFFPEAVVQEREPHAYPTDEHATPSLYVTHLPRAFKDLPPEDEATPYLYSFLAGWFAADGDVTKTGSVRLWSADRAALEWVHRVALSRLGIVTSIPKETVRQGIEGIWRPIWSIHFDRGSLRSSFFVRAHHRARYEQRAISAEPNYWQVVAVEQTSEVEEVFCAVVPGTETFVLDGMILTGNCRNIELVEPQRPRAQRRRIERTGVRVHELVVFPTGKTTRARDGVRVGGTPLTSVRGHWAKYGPQYNRGLLFGKYSGRFWIPAFARGSTEHGEVHKDFRIEVPSS